MSGVRIVLAREAYDAALKQIHAFWVGGPSKLPVVVGMWR